MTMNSIIPTYGNWGGPGWSAGERTLPNGKIDWSVIGVDELDEIFKKHDFNYNEADKPENSNIKEELIYYADIEL